jgi:hypothetical protein
MMIVDSDLHERLAKGDELHANSIVLDIAGVPHHIDHLREYPGVFVGGHARIAYECAEEANATWRCTIADNEVFHVLA